jgi:hypothetical protein
MGGFGSGRPGYRASTTSGLNLNLNKLFRDGLLRPENTTAGTLEWTETSSGTRVAWMRYSATLHSDRGHLRLMYRSTFPDGSTHDSDYALPLETTAQKLGGRRWWFVCPKSGRRAWKLYLPAGATMFASRSAYRLAYPCQREHPRDRSLRRAFKERRRLGSDLGIGDYILKPKWMRLKTYDRLLNRVWEAEAAVDYHGALLLDRLK